MSESKTSGLRRPRWAVVALTMTLAALAAFTPLLLSEDTLEFTDVRQQTLQFIEFERTIELSPEQEEVKREALSSLPAPCCSDNSAYTCCCPCNSAKAWWGLAAHLIVDKGYDAEQVRSKVADWFEFINPGGFSGDACYTRGCARPFDANGCGGMDDQSVVFDR